MFNEVIDEVVQEVAKRSKFSAEEIRACMEMCSQDTRPDITLFIIKISQSPQEDADQLLKQLREASLDIIEDIEARGPSVTFNINKRRIFSSILEHIQDRAETYGHSDVGRGRRVLVDYSSPNIAKVFHVGHFRTTVLGKFIVNLLKASGYEVVGINYLGDWGKQFGMVLLGYEKYGSDEKLQLDPLRHLFDVYVQINQDAKKDPSVDGEAREIFRRMEEEEDPMYLGIWSKFRELSIEKYKKLYKRLDIEFDVYEGESMYNKMGREIIEECPLVRVDEDGSRVFDLGELGNVLVMKSDGTTLYITRDIAAARERIARYSPEKIIYVVSNEQNRHFEQLFGAMRQMGYDPDMFLHVNYGMVQGMSTREGNVHFLEDIINTATDIMKKEILSNEEKASVVENIDETARILGISALLVMDFTAKRIKGYKFDVERRTKNVSGTGPYLQYAHCRLKSIEDKNALDCTKVNYALVATPDVLRLSYKLLWFEHIVERCLGDYEPSRIVTYLQDLASTANVMVGRLRVKGTEEELAKARLLVLSSIRTVLRSGMRLLGITPLNRM
jgi:arginyl-tRNA synthetase